MACYGRHISDNFSEARLVSAFLASTLTAGRDSYGSIDQDNATTLANFVAYILSLQDYDEDKNLQRGVLDGTYISRRSRDQKRNVASRLDLGCLHDLVARGNAARFIETAVPLCECRRLFLTMNGYLGLGPDTLREGDVLCVLAGGDLPFILRPVKQKVDKPQSKNVSVRNTKTQGSTADHYLFAGECHVEGLMNGEAIEALNSRRDFCWTN